MRRFLIGGHLDGTDKLSAFTALVEERRPDAILFTGGILGENAVRPAQKSATWKSFFSELGKLATFTAIVPGESDVPLRLFLRAAKDAEVAFPHLHIAHATLFEEGDVALEGLGGELTEEEDDTNERLRYARPSAEYFLRSLWAADQPRKILLMSVAPKGRLGGARGNGVGGDFIDSYHPALCAVGGVTERRGSERIAHTLIINPGRLADGSAAWLDWKRTGSPHIEMLSV